MLERVDHLVVAVSDLDAATDTYAGLLGLSPSWQGTHPGAGTANAIFRLDNTYLELLAPHEEGPIGAMLRAKLDRDGEGPAALAFATRDLDTTVADLASRGIETTSPADGEGKDATGNARRWRSTFLSPQATRGLTTILIEHASPSDALSPALPRGSSDGAVSAVDHVVILTSDPDDAIVLYRDKLGIRLALDRTFEERGMRLLFFRLGGLTLECAATSAQGGAAGVGDRFWGISYRVRDIEAARARLAAAGFDVSEVRSGMKPDTRVCTVRKETHGVATLIIAPDEGSTSRTRA